MLVKARSHTEMCASFWAFSEDCRIHSIAESRGTSAGILECNYQFAADDPVEAQAFACSEVCDRCVSMVVVMLYIFGDDHTTICSRMTQMSLQHHLVGC